MMHSTGHARFEIGQDEDHPSDDEMNGVNRAASSTPPPPTPKIIIEPAGAVGVENEKRTKRNGVEVNAGVELGTHEKAGNGCETSEKDRVRAEALGSGTKVAEESKPPYTPFDYLQDVLDPYFAWAKPKLNWKGWRPVIRASIAGWVGLVLMLAGPTGAFLGQASFLVLIVSVISPAAYPIATMLELSFFQFAIIGASWAYAAFGLWIAHISRRKFRYTQAEFIALAGEKFASQGIPAYAITTQIQEQIFHGTFLEARSSAVCGIFLGVGIGYLLWLRQRLGPGPALFGIIFGIILLIICFTTAVLFPYYYASVGLIFFLPFACQQAIQLATSFLILPETLGHQFSDRLVTTLTPLKSVIRKQQEMLKTDPRSADWLKFKSIKAGVQGSMGGLALLGASEANLTREVSYGRVSGKDLIKVLKGVHILVARSTGFISFYEIVEKHLHRESSASKGGAVADELIVHIAHSHPASPDHSRPASPDPESRKPQAPVLPPRSQSASHHVETSNVADPHELSSALDVAHREAQATPPRSYPHSLTTGSRNSSSGSLADLHEGVVNSGQSSHQHHTTNATSKKRTKSRNRYSSSNRHKNKSSSSLLHDILHPNIEVPRPVGMFESQRYMDLEDFLHNPRDEEHLREIVGLLNVASSELLESSGELLSSLIDLIHALKISNNIVWRTLRRMNWFRTEVKARAVVLKELDERIERVNTALTAYRDIRRLDVIRPFATLFDPISHLGPDGTTAEHTFQAPSHRGLFWALSYQFSLISWSEALLGVSQECLKIGNKRKHPRLWTPEWAKFHFAKSSAEATFEEESPESVELLNRSVFRAPRDPDHRPARTTTQVIGVKFNHGIQFLARNEFLFAVKIAIVIGVCAMPAFFPTSCFFFYRERGIWPLVMIALTSTLYIGDTTFGFIIRLVGTIFGAIIGLLLWSIAAQTGPGNPFAAAAVMAVAMPFIFFFRIYYTPVPTAIIPPVTIVLVFGYSWQGAHHATLGSVGYGWSVAWRRLVCVALGVVVAFLVAFIPPKVTQKKGIRKTYANVINSMGGVLCQIVSFAACKEDGIVAPPSVIQKNIAALRDKVSKTTASKSMVRFEWSWAGKWPEKHYTSLQTLQMEMLDLFGQLLAVLASLDKKWTKAILHRSQLSNPQFLGDMLTTFQLISSALRDGTQLPMIYNPLLERFLKSPEAQAAHRQYGFDIALKEEDEIEGIPSHVTLETICSIEYLRYSCGISQVYAIINRLDRLMFITKALVGEHYIMYGLEALNGKHSGGGGGKGGTDAEDAAEEERRWLRHDESDDDDDDSHTGERNSYDAGEMV